MPIKPSDCLRAFILNVGQADSCVLVMPGGQVVLIDAVNPTKVVRLLNDLGLGKGDEIAHLVLTHPHSDHYSGAGRLLKEYRIGKVTVAPYEFFCGKYGYQAVLEEVRRQNVIASYAYHAEESFPTKHAPVRLRVIGPSKAILKGLSDAGKLNPNHLSLIVQIMYGKAVLLLAADAQMENWQHFDAEGFLDSKCLFLKAAHHGSRHGTQIERLERLNPKYAVISSDPEGRDHLPDLVGAASFLVYSRDHVVAMTAEAGTVGLTVKADGSHSTVGYGDKVGDPVPLDRGNPLRGLDLKNWTKLVQTRLSEL